MYASRVLIALLLHLSLIYCSAYDEDIILFGAGVSNKGRIYISTSGTTEDEGRIFATTREILTSNAEELNKEERNLDANLNRIELTTHSGVFSTESAIADDYYKSCYSSRVVKDVSFCSGAQWLSARLYPLENYSLFQPDSYLTDHQQDSYARKIHDNILKRANKKEDTLSTYCDAALTEYICMDTFPLCPIGASNLGGSSYMSPCRSQCERAKFLCDKELNGQIECDHLSDVNCAVYVPNGYFILPASKGPYDGTSTLYYVMLALWSSMGVWWFYFANYVYKNQCMNICKLVSLFPALKVLTIILSISFWQTCEDWRICSFWIGVSLININLVYESAQVIVFLLIAKGWSITRTVFGSGEWRSVVITMVMFYLSNSIILILRASIKNSTIFWSISCIPYIIMYSKITYCAYFSVKAVNRQTRGVHMKLNHEIIKPIVGKMWMIYLFLVVTFLFFVVEILVHGMFIDNAGFFNILLLFEVSHLVLFMVLGYIFRPREHSPFFYLATTLQNIASTNTGSERSFVPVVKAFDLSFESIGKLDDEHSKLRDVEIECVPLLEKCTIGTKGNELDKIIIVKQSQNTIAVATSV